MVRRGEWVDECGKGEKGGRRQVGRMKGDGGGGGM